MSTTTVSRLVALLMWFVGVGVIIAPPAWEISNDTIGALMMLTALILLRICDLEDRLKRMSDEGDTAREDAPDALLRDVLNLTRSDSAREARRHLKAKRTFGEHSQEDQ